MVVDLFSEKALVAELDSLIRSDRVTPTCCLMEPSTWAIVLLEPDTGVTPSKSPTEPQVSAKEERHPRVLQTHNQADQHPRRDTNPSSIRATPQT